MNSKIKGLTKNSLIYSIGSLLPIIISVFLIPIYTRFLSTADYGILSIADIITKIMTIVLGLGLPIAVVRFYHEYRNNSAHLSQYFGSIMMLVVLVGVVITGAIYFWGEPLFKYLIKDYDSLFNPYIIFAIWTSFFMIPISILINWLQAQNKAWQHIAVTLVTFLLVSGLTVYYVAFQEAGAEGAVKAGLIASVILFVLIIPFVLKTGSFNFAYKLVKPSLKFGLPLIPTALAAWLLIFIDRIIITNIMGLSDMGIYSLGYSAGMVMALVVASIHKAWAPFFYQHANSNESPKIFGKIITYYVTVIALIGLVGSLFSTELIELITTPAFYGAATVVPLVILGYIFYGFYNLASTPIFHKKMTLPILWFTLIAAIVNILLNFWLIPIFGIMGAAYATTISYLLLMILGIWKANQLYKIPYELAKLAQIIAYSGIAYTLAMYFFPQSILLKILVVIALALMFVAFKIVRKDIPSYFKKTL